MTRIATLIGAVIIAVALAPVGAGCSSVELAPRTVKARTGPALGKRIRRIVAVRASCGSLSSFNRTSLRDGPSTTSSTTSAAGARSGSREHSPGRYESTAVECPQRQIDGVDQLVRSALEFHGYSVIDSERVNAITAERRQIIVKETSDDEGTRSSSSSSETTVTGSLFGDAPPAMQDAILAELGADGVLNARIFVGAPIARSLRRHIDVQVRLLHVASGELVWASRCRVEAGWTVNEEPIMEAAKCAVDRITGAKR